MSKLKIAVAGLGAISQIVHMPFLSKMQNAEVTAVCDKSLAKARTIAAKFGIKNFYKDAEEMLKDCRDNIDAVIIASTTDAHKDIAILCAEYGKHILIERPAARNLHEAEEIYKAAKKNNIKVMVGMNSRFRNDVMLEKTFVKGKELGEIFYVKTGWVKTQSTNQKWAVEKDKSGGGVFMDNGLVMLDLSLWMMGFPEPERVSAVTYYHNTKNVEDSGFATIKFKNGALLTIEVSWSLFRDGESYYCSVFGKSGSAYINPIRIYKKLGEEIYNITPKNIKEPADQFKRSYEYELQHFVGAIQGDYELLSTIDEALIVLKVIGAIYESANSGKEVTVK